MTETFEKYTLGALRSKEDKRDWCIKASAALYPDELHTKPRAAFDQGIYGTCVMQPIRRGMQEFWNKKFGIFIPYGRWRSHMLIGMFPNEAYTGLCKEGMATEEAIRESEYEMPRAKSQANSYASAFIPAAAPFSGGSWHRLTTEAEIKAALMQVKALEDKGLYGAHVGFCFPVASFKPNKYDVWEACKMQYGNFIGYHWVQVTGWGPHEDFPDGSKREMTKVLNSWGTEWGDHGYCWMYWSDILLANNVIAWFPPYKEEPEDPIVRRRTLRKGMEGEDVAELQHKLLKLDYDLGKWGADGDFGSKTRAAVKKFQRKNALNVDGIVGPKTWEVLDDKA